MNARNKIVTYYKLLTKGSWKIMKRTEQPKMYIEDTGIQYPRDDPKWEDAAQVMVDRLNDLWELESKEFGADDFKMDDDRYLDVD